MCRTSALSAAGSYVYEIGHGCKKGKNQKGEQPM